MLISGYDFSLKASVKQIYWTLSFLVLLWLLVSCARPIDRDAQKQARAGLDIAVAQIPQIADFTSTVFHKLTDYAQATSGRPL